MAKKMIGHSKDEFQASGVDFANRGKRWNEKK